ncbi:MAG TPA: quinone-dependent dihydroorotate dehydrogenase [Verrucomicrobiae bacterium]|jgi:dihydroorotate dehydrogenase
MSWFYRAAIRPVLFTQDAESIHHRTMAMLAWAGRNELVCDAMRSFLGAPELPVELFGLRFPNPVGLAAGMDKNAEALPAWAAMGFGFTELGAATWLAQPGNPQPRVFRAIPEEAIVNRMGFNNFGAEAIAEKLVEWKKLGRWPKHPVGMNLGKSKITPLDKAAEDYANSFRVLRPHLDFFVVNVSSPNTPNLRQLQDKSALDGILAALQEVRKAESGKRKAESENSGDVPILVKVAPDLSFEALDEILELVGPRQIAGIVATNTTISRPAATVADVQRVYAETGGLSGRPLRARSTEVIRHLYRQTRGTLPIIGVGGIFTAADAWEKIAAGASLVQVYTGLVYEGPSICRSIVNGLIERMEAKGIAKLQSAVGCEVDN